MCSRFNLRFLGSSVLLHLLSLVTFLTAHSSEQRVLRIAADPNNLPFSNERLEGFENKLADMIAQELGAKVEYIWRAQRRGFFRETLKNGDCELVLGVPVGFERALTTRPYYWSSYVVVCQKEKELKIDSLDDPRLRTLRIGVQLVGDDGANTPPVHELCRRGIITNIVGYTLYGDYRQSNPPARIMDAVAHGDVDVAIVWGPLAGYFAKKETVPLQVTQLRTDKDSTLPFSFGIGMGVKRKDAALRDELNEVLARKADEVENILREYGIPTVAASDESTAQLEK